MNPWSSNATGPRSQEACTVSGGCTAAGAAWWFCCPSAPCDPGRGPGTRGAGESRDDEDDVRGQGGPERPFLFLRGHAGADDSVLVLRVREEDLHVTFRLRQTRWIRIYGDRLDALDLTVVERAHHLAACPADSDDRDLRVDRVLKQAADDFVHVIPGYHHSASDPIL